MVGFAAAELRGERQRRYFFELVLNSSLMRFLWLFCALLLFETDALRAQQLSQAGAAAGAPSAAGDAAAPRIEEVRIGIGGTYKVGHWTPVRLRLRGGSRPQRVLLEIVSHDADGTAVTFLRDAPLQLAPEQELALFHYVKLGPPQYALSVRLRDADTGNSASDSAALAEQRFADLKSLRALRSTDPWFVAFTAAPDVAAQLTQQGARLLGMQLTVWDAADEFPDAWYGYDGIDTLALLTTQPGRLEQLDEAQQGALTTWVRLGGRVILSVGRNAERLIQPGQPLHALEPGKSVRTATLRSTSALEAFVEATQRVSLREPIPAVLLEDVEGNVDFRDALGVASSAPLLIHSTLGLGQLTFVAFDLDHPALLAWPGWGKLLARVAGAGSRALAPPRPQERGQLSHLGFTDLMGQFRTAMDQFPGVVLVQFSWVASLLVLYILMIGPADYFVLRKLGLPMHVTWFSFPLVVIGFGALAVGLNQAAKGDQRRVNQVEILDLDVGTGLQRGTSWFHLYTPSSRRFSFAYVPQPGSAPPGSAAGRGPACLLCWSAPPGDGLGGLDVVSTAPLPGEPYTCRIRPEGEHVTSEVAGLAIPAGATRGLVARWWETVTPEGPSGTPTNGTPSETPAGGTLFTDRDGLLRGTVRNPFPVTLHEATLLYENWAYRVDRPLRPGEEVVVQSLRPLNYQWRVTRRRVVEHADIPTPWDQSSRDVSRIVELLMFHGAAGGETYTQLTHRYLPFLDLSPHLNRGRAILMGECRDRHGQLLWDGEPVAAEQSQVWRFCRASLAVQRSKGE